MSSSTEKTISSGHLNLVSEGMPELKVIHTTDELELLRQGWERLTAEGEFTIYQSYQWNKTWWKHFGEGKKLHVVTIFDARESLIGIAPFFQDTITMGGKVLFSALRLLGSTVSVPAGNNLLGLHPYSDYLDLILKPGFEAITTGALIHYLEQNKTFYDEIILDEIPSHSSIWKHFVPGMQKKGFGCAVEKSSVCPLIELGGSWEDYQNSLSKKQRYNNNKALRQINNNSAKGFFIKEVIEPDELFSVYNLMVVMHQKRWNALGFPGAFAEKRMYYFMKDVIKGFSTKGWITLRTAESVMEKGKIVAVDLIFEYKTRAYLVHRALDQESDYSKYGPGNVLLSLAIKKATEKHMDVLDFLRGEEAFKFRTATNTATNKRITFTKKEKSTRRSSMLKHCISARRRLTIEWIQFRLFMKRKTLNPGLRGYTDFIKSRLEAKLKVGSNQ